MREKQGHGNAFARQSSVAPPQRKENERSEADQRATHFFRRSFTCLHVSYRGGLWSAIGNTAIINSTPVIMGRRVPDEIFNVKLR